MMVPTLLAEFAMITRPCAQLIEKTDSYYPLKHQARVPLRSAANASIRSRAILWG
jgi:hypothetical protein